MTSDKSIVRIEQLIHGYRRGHELLAGSTRLDRSEADLITRLSDLSGSLSGQVMFGNYLTGYCLPDGDYYVLARTWIDEDAPRAGCVLTHTLLLPIELWMSCRDPQSLLTLFSRPDDRDDLKSYTETLKYREKDTGTAPANADIDFDLCTEFVARFFGEGISPLIWFGKGDNDSLSMHVARALWPRLRKSFSFCTMCLQPRTVAGQPMDLMFAPTASYSRFHEYAPEHLLDSGAASFQARSTGPSAEPWYLDYAKIIFAREGIESFDPDTLSVLQKDLDNDPTSIRRVFLINKMRTRIPDSPMSAVGLLDVVESVAPCSDHSVDFKQDMIALALKAASNVHDPSEALECYYLINERMSRSAFINVSKKQSEAVSFNMVEDLTQQSPESAVKFVAKTLKDESESRSTLFVQHVLNGFCKLSVSNPGCLSVLRNDPEFAQYAFRHRPLIAVGFVRGMKSLESSNKQYQTGIAWFVDTISSSITPKLREKLVSLITSENDAPLLDVVLKSISEEDVYDTLTSLQESTRSFKNPVLRHSLVNEVCKRFPRAVREWIRTRSLQTEKMADLLAGTYESSPEGLRELLDDSNEYETSVSAASIAAFVDSIGTKWLPQWLVSEVRQEPRIMIPLLAAEHSSLPRVTKCAQRLLEGVEGLQIARYEEIVNAIGHYASTEIYRSLIEAATKSSVALFLRGELDSKQYEAMQSSAWASDWLERARSAELGILLRDNISSDHNTWRRAWSWLRSLPSTVYGRSSVDLAAMVDSLIVRNRPWDETVAEMWVSILRRVAEESSKSLHLEMCSEALRFSFDTRATGLGKVVAAAFSPVYEIIVASRSMPPETRRLFGYFTWDRGKELRKQIISAFMNSEWAPGDLAIATRDKSLRRKIFKRVQRRLNGSKYIESMLKDLREQDGVVAAQAYDHIEEMARNPNFTEAWD